MADFDNIKGRNGLDEVMRQTLKAVIGDRASLTTTEKGTLVGAMNEMVTSIAAVAEDVTTLQGAVADNQADSTAADVAGLVTDFNALLAKLKAAGLMEADA